MSIARLAAWPLGAGLALGVTTSLLNHAQVLGSVAAVYGSGVAWGAFGIVAALLLGVRRARVGWLPRAGAVTVFYLGACLTYYLTDWLFSIPSTLRFQEDIHSRRLPAPRLGDGSNLAPDLGEWLLWSVLSIPAALLVSGIAYVLLRWARPSVRARDED